MRLYDTARQDVVPFIPGTEVRMYVCGLTPYDSTHLGHAHTYLSYDLLARRLDDRGHSVRMVRNVTDVDDSILSKARELGVGVADLAAAEMSRFHRDMEALCVRPPAAEPKATEWIDEMVALIERLDAADHVYSIEGTTWFDVSTWPGFGRLSGLDEESMLSLAERRGGTPGDPRLRNPLDFVLWQPSLPDEPSWESPFGPGRPGWHIECSAMCMGLLGTGIDLHGGGGDLVFPHHECEMAQSEAVVGEPLAKHWMHCGMVAHQGVKMSKSLGNLVFVRDLISQARPAAVRLALMGHHYRRDWEWQDNYLREGEAQLGILTEAVGRGDYKAGDSSGDCVSDGFDPAPFAWRVRDALDDDLDAPRARSALLELAEAVLVTGKHTGIAPAVLSELCELCGISVPRVGRV